MMHRYLILLFLGFMATAARAQIFTLHGKITNSKLEPIAYASVQVKEIRSGTSTKEDGTYELRLEQGKYDLIISMIGYKNQTVSIVLTHDHIQNIILEEGGSQDLAEIVVKAKAKDRAEEIVRNVIRNKENILSAAGPYSCLMYIKAVQQDSSRKKTASKDTGADAGLRQMIMTEVFTRLDVNTDGNIKEERMGVKKRGRSEYLFHLSAREGNFNFYNNLVNVPSVSSTPFVSPVSYSGLMAYKFKTLKIDRTGKHKVYTISVKPRQVSNATVEGEITISDSSWAILKTRFRFPRYHMPEYDFFEVVQQYSFVQDKAWMISRQQFTYYTKTNRKKVSGQTTVSYSGFELNKLFGRKHFGTEVSATSTEAYQQDSSFWKSARTEPLSEKEVRYIHYEDSLYRVSHTRQYLDSMDRIMNRVTWKKVSFTGQKFYHRDKERTLYLPSLVSLYQPFAFGGSRLKPSLYYAKVFPNRKEINLWTHLSYGIRNKDLNGTVDFKRLYNPFNRGYYRLFAGRDFEQIYGNDAWINQIKRSNVYLNNYAAAAHEVELVNGLFLYNEFRVAFRRSVSGYKTGHLVDSLFSDVLTNNQAVAFEPYNASYGKVRLQFTPRQRYVREPKEKIILGSRWPTFFTTWRKGIPGLMASKVDFDYIEFGLQQRISAGLLGNSRYMVKTGTFLSKKNLKLIDYQFQRQGDPMWFQDPDENFQALDSTFPVFKHFFEGHYVHEFNGFFLNKIPLFKKLGLREIGGAGFLLAPERNLRYAEAFVGLERAFRWPFDPLERFKLGIYVTGSVANQFNNPIQLKVGLTTWDKRRNKWY